MRQRVVEKDQEKGEETQDVEFGMIEALGERAGWKRGHRAIPRKTAYGDMVAGGKSDVKVSQVSGSKANGTDHLTSRIVGGCERYRPDFATRRAESDGSGVPRMWISHEEKNMHRVCSNLATFSSV